uniref:Uncharacterized protein n=1 Tax=Panagrolaimus sp. PS1159 TaxID=55785 RepID=A0AC35GW66_9BILA
MHPSYNPATSNIREYPSNVIKYIKQNAAPEQLLNLMQCSERFVIPYLPVQNLIIDKEEEDGWRIRKLDNSLIQGINCDEVPNNLWITTRIYLHGFPNLLPQILPKIAVIQLEQLSFFRQATSCDDLVKLLSHGNVIIIKLWSSPVKYGDGDLVPLDEMLEICSKYSLHFLVSLHFRYDLPPFSVEAAENHSKLVASTKLIYFSLVAYKETFDFGLHKMFIELNRQICFDTYFLDHDLEDDFIEELQHLNGITLENGLTENPPNMFYYRGIPQETLAALDNLYSEYLELLNNE